MAFNPADRISTRIPADIGSGRRIVPVPQAPGAPTPGAAPFQRTVFPWWQTKPPQGIDFNVQSFAVVLGAGVGTQATSPAVAFQMPQTSVGVVQTFSLYILSPVAADLVQYALRINQAPVPGWDNKQIVPGAANFVKENWTGITVLVPNNALVDVLFTNLNGTGPLTVGAQVTGWYLSVADIRRLNGEGY